MGKIIYITIFLIAIVVSNWFCYVRLIAYLNYIDLIIFFTVAILTIITGIIIEVKKISIADYWNTKKHVRLYWFILMTAWNIFFNLTTELYKHLGIWVVIFLNFTFVLLFLIDKEDKNRRKKEIEDYNQEYYENHS